MSKSVCGLAVVLVALIPGSANAYPDGAPWGAANPAATENCTSCHYERDAVNDSAVLAIDGLPSRPLPGSRYELQITFTDPMAVTAGFQLFVQAPGDQTGTFSSSSQWVEFVGGAIRSTAPLQRDSGMSWSLAWQAPNIIELPLIFFLAASSSNDDGSPFGDAIHYRRYQYPVEPR